MTTWLHHKRLDTVHAAVIESGARSIIDMGCGEGDLIVRLAQEAQLSRITGIDVCRDALERVGKRIAAAPPEDGPVVELRLGSVLERNDFDQPFDCAVLVEVIEHIEPDRLSQLERGLFCEMAPNVVLITTPNAEYNPLLGVPPHRFRHPDHRFEWTRARFRLWAEGVASRNAYDVIYADVGGTHPRLGGPSQMATFRRQSPSNAQARETGKHDGLTRQEHEPGAP